MADESTPVITVSTVDEDTGEESTITLTVDMVEEMAGDEWEKELPDYLDECLEVVENYGGEVEIDLRPKYNIITDSDALPLFTVDEQTSLLPGRYRVVYISSVDDGLTDEEHMRLERAGAAGIVIAKDESQIVGRGVGLVEVTRNIDGEETFVGLALLNHKTGEYINLTDLLNSLAGHALASIALQKLQDSGAITISRGEDETLVHIDSARLDEVDRGTDKLNRNVWGQFADMPPGQTALGFMDGGVLDLSLNTASAKDRANGVQRLVSYAIDFDALEESSIAPRLEPYDHRVYEAVSSLFNHTGRSHFTLKEIHFAMGFGTEPSKAQKKKLNDSLTKMMRAHISVDNQDEIATYDYPHYVYDGALLPMERVTGYVDGQIANGVIHVFREPPLFTFARERKQFTTHSVRVLQTPLNKNDTNIRIEDYLLEQIDWMRHGKRSRTILYETLFEKTGITRRDAKSRKRKDVKKLLDHYVSVDLIKGYKENKESVEIEL